MKVDPQKEHHWLLQLVGEWECEMQCVMAPGQPPTTSRGKESVRTLGGLWALCEGRGEMPDGGECVTQMTLGYDPARKRYVGSFIGSMMTHKWEYDGQLDETGKVLTLDTEGPSFTGEGKMARYQDVIEITGDGERVLRSQVKGDDGQWHRFMTATYRRVA